MNMKLTQELKARISTPTQFQNCLKLKKNEANIYFLPIIDMRGIISSDTSPPHKVHTCLILHEFHSESVML